MHKYFGLDNEKGLSTVAVGRDSLADALVCVNVEGQTGGDGAGDYQSWARGSEACSRMYVLPSEPIPPNPGEIVSSRRFDAVLEALSREADLVLVDSPPLLCARARPLTSVQSSMHDLRP